MATLAELIVKIGADASNFEKQMGAMERKLNRTGGQLQSMGTKLSVGLTAPIVALGSASISMAGDFQKSMNRVAAVSGATDSEFEALKTQAKDLGRTTVFSASQAADAMGFLAMAGFKTNEILGAMPGTLELAAASQMDLGRTADIVTNILTGYGLEVQQLGHANDVLMQTMTSTNVNLEMLGESLKYVGPVASGVGLQFEEVSAAVGMLGNAGIQGSMAGTALRGAISALVNPTKAVSDRLTALGVSVTDSAGNMIPLVDIVRQLETAGATTADMMAIFGDRAGPAMAALVDQGSSALANLTLELEHSAGTAEEIAQTQLQGFAGATEELRSAFEGFMIQIGESGLIEWVTSLVERLTGFVQRLSETNPELLRLGTIIGIVAAAIGPLLIGVGTIIRTFSGLAGTAKLVTGGFGTLTAFGGQLADGFALWSGGAGSFGEVLSLVAGGPIPLIIAGIAGVIAIGVAVWKNWDEIKDKLASIWNSIKDTAARVWDGIVTAIKAPINAIISAINVLIRGLNKISFSIPSWVPVLGGKSWGFNVPEIAMLASGGIVTRPTLSIVGEAGPEAVVPLAQARNLGFGGPGPVTIIIEVDGRRIAQATAPHLTDLIRLKTGVAY